MRSSLLRSTTVWIKGMLPTMMIGGCCIVVIVVVGGGAFTRTRQQQRRRKTELLMKDKSSNDDNSIDTNYYKNCIYMDYNGTTPIYTYVYNAMIPYLTVHYGNPGSIQHMYGTIPYNAIVHARYQILKYLLQCPNVVIDGSCDHEMKYPQNDDDNDDDTNQNNTVTTTTTTTTTPLSSCIFTSCGTEADNLMIHIALQLWKLRRHPTRQNNNSSDDDDSTNDNNIVLPHIITTNIEHPAIDACLQIYEQNQICTVTRVPVQNDGRVTIQDMIDTIQKYATTTILVTIMLANNEMGAIQPVKEISEYIHTHHTHILFGTDAAQATGKMNISLHHLGYPDMMTIVGHKFGTPKGIACLYIKPGCLNKFQVVSSSSSSSSSNLNNDDNNNNNLKDPNIHGILIGGGQEYTWRGGTSNVPYIVALGIAAEYTAQHLQKHQQHMEYLRTRFIQQITNQLGSNNICIHGPIESHNRLPNTISIGFSNNIDSTKLLYTLQNVVAASAGATCHAAPSSSSSSCNSSSSNHTNRPVISRILQAMQIPEIWARSTIRISIGPPTTIEEVDRAVQYIADAVRQQWNEEMMKN